MDYFEENSVLIFRKAGEAKTEKCPFCNNRHIHGSDDGHRIAHCTTGTFKESVEINGRIYYQKDGYIIKEF